MNNNKRSHMANPFKVLAVLPAKIPSGLFGKYRDGEEKRLDILIMYLEKELTVERARSMLRNFVAGYLRGNYGSDAVRLQRWWHLYPQTD